MASLYEIRQEILSCIDEDTGEVIDFDRLAELTMAETDKLEAVALWIKNLAADAEAYRREAAAFTERATAANTKIEKLKKWLGESLGGEKFATERVAVSFRRTKAVSIVDTEAIPTEYLRVKTEVEPDKTKMMAALKTGAEIPGAQLAERLSVTIK